MVWGSSCLFKWRVQIDTPLSGFEGDVKGKAKDSGRFVEDTGFNMKENGEGRGLQTRPHFQVYLILN